MKLVDPYTGKMECRVCGAEHFARLAAAGRYYRGSWQCRHGCRPKDIWHRASACEETTR